VEVWGSSEHGDFVLFSVYFYLQLQMFPQQKKQEIAAMRKRYMG